MHTVDFESDSWLYRIFEIYHVKYTDICSILYLDTFSVHLSVKSHVTMLSTQISYKKIIYAQCGL